MKPLQIIIAAGMLMVVLVSGAVGIFVYNHNTFAAKAAVEKLETETVETFEDLEIRRTLEELEKLDAKEKFNEGGLNKYDEVRKKQLERKLEQSTKPENGG